MVMVGTLQSDAPALIWLDLAHSRERTVGRDPRSYGKLVFSLLLTLPYIFIGIVWLTLFRGGEPPHLKL